jgi:hypothetical protein
MHKSLTIANVGKRNTDSTMDFLHDLRGRVLGQPEISTDGFLPYRAAIRDAFGDSASRGVIVKTYSETHLAKDAVILELIQLPRHVRNSPLADMPMDSENVC